jgi:hypothetical protein
MARQSKFGGQIEFNPDMVRTGHVPVLTAPTVPYTLR